MWSQVRILSPRLSKRMSINRLAVFLFFLIHFSTPAAHVRQPICQLSFPTKKSRANARKKLKESESARKHIQLIIKRHCERSEVVRARRDSDNPECISETTFAAWRSSGNDDAKLLFSISLINIHSCNIIIFHAFALKFLTLS